MGHACTSRQKRMKAAMQGTILLRCRKKSLQLSHSKLVDWRKISLILHFLSNILKGKCPRIST